MTQPGAFSDQQIGQLKGVFDAYFGEIKAGLGDLAKEAIKEQLGPVMVEAAQKPAQVIEGQARIVNGDQPASPPSDTPEAKPASDDSANLRDAIPLLTALLPLVQAFVGKGATPDVTGMMNQVAAFNQSVNNAFLAPIMEYVRYGATLGANAFGAAVKATGHTPDPVEYAKNIGGMDISFVKPPGPATDPAPVLHSDALPGNANRAARLAQL